MGRPRKSSTGGFSRQYIYNLRSELNELLDRIELDSASPHLESWKARIEELRSMLGDEVVPFRERARAARLAKLAEEQAQRSQNEASEALSDLEKLISDGADSSKSNPNGS